MKKAFKILLLKKALILVVLSLMLVQQQHTYAQALPVANYVINKTVGKAIVANLERRGVQYAANDAAFARTMNYVGTAANDAMYAHAAVTTIAAVAGAPVWLTVALGVGAVAAVGALAWGAYELSQKSAPEAMPNGEPVPQALVLATPGYDPVSNPQPQPAPEPGPVPVPSIPPAVGVPSPTKGAPLAYPDFYRTPFGACIPQTDAGCIVWPSVPTTKRYISHQLHHQSPGFQAVAGDTLIEVLYKAAQAKLAYESNRPFQHRNWFMTWTTIFVPTPGCVGDPGACQWKLGYHIYYEKLQTPDTNPYDSVDDSIWGIPVNGDGERAYFGGEIYVDPNPAWQSPFGQAYTGTLANINTAITPSMLAEPVPDVLTAQMANRLWQKAASKPGYDGLPYSVTDPITPADIAAIRAQNTSPMPTWNDLLHTTPNAPGTPSVPISPDLAPVVTNPTPNPTSNPTSGTSVDLGPYPNIGSPALENVPTAQMILGPLISLFPSFRGYAVPAHAAECPKPSMNLFNRSIILDAHCGLLDGVRPTLYAVMAFVWVIVGLFIVLGA